MSMEPLTPKVDKCNECGTTTNVDVSNVAEPELCHWVDVHVMPHGTTKNS
jgi:hypothetical protein